MGAQLPLRPQDERILAILTQAAAAGAVCPTNEQLADAIGAAEASQPATIMRKLRNRGVITVEQLGKHRQVTIVASGEATAEITGKRRDRVAELAKAAKTKAEGQPAQSTLAALVEPLPTVNREPCTWCGTRRDVGCKHHPIPSGPHAAAGSPAAGTSPSLPAVGASVSLFHGETYAE